MPAILMEITMSFDSDNQVVILGGFAAFLLELRNSLLITRCVIVNFEQKDNNVFTITFAHNDKKELQILDQLIRQITNPLGNLAIVAE